MDPTPGIAAADAEHLEITIVFNFRHRILHLHGSGRGTKSSPRPQTAELGEVERLTKKPRGAPSPERKRRDTKHPADSTTASKTPPAGTQPNSTLYTSRDPWFPHPPAAGAAAGGGGDHESPASKVRRPGALTKSPLSTVDGRGERPRKILHHLLMTKWNIFYFF
jgi:hypothetical protein